MGKAGADVGHSAGVHTGLRDSTPPSPEMSPEQIEAFIARWAASDADEKANSQPFLSELCDLLGVPRPDVATSAGGDDAYCFEKRVQVTYKGEAQSTKFIDLYRRDCFVLEAKQGRHKEVAASRFGDPTRPTKTGTAVRGTAGYADAMEKAFRQARAYARSLPAGDGWPPFLIVVDIGFSIELYADFTRSGRDWRHFPHASRSRISLDRLRSPETRALLRTVWLDPMSLDPTARSARVTQAIAERLAKLARSLEEDGHDTEAASHFLMRCLFCMFAEDSGLLPEGAFTDLLAAAKNSPSDFEPLMAALFAEMNRGGFSATLRQKIKRFNGGLFAESPDEPAALPLDADQIGLLIEASRADWREVEPAIFGTLLERALDPRERHKLGAHYTPREYVERLVLPTVMEPLREEWDAARVAASQQENAGDTAGAIGAIQRFHRRLCEVRVLDPACGSGNFLYVTLAQMKRLEAEVLRRLDELDHAQAQLEMAGFRVNPSQFLGIEINPRAAAVADLVLWIGYLQWQLDTNRAGTIPEPVLQAFGNIECRDALIVYDDRRPKLDENGEPLTRWDGITTKMHPVTGDQVPDPEARVPVWEFENPTKAAWPVVDFIVGNPPFLGVRTATSSMDPSYLAAVRAAFSDLPETADLVMYWFELASVQLDAGPGLRRFGFISTNSIVHAYSRPVLERALERGQAIAFAVPDHPWVDDAGSAAVRISMVVVHGPNGAVTPQVGEYRAGTLVTRQAKRVSARLVADLDFDSAVPLAANAGMVFQGFISGAAGFRLTREQVDSFQEVAPHSIEVIRSLVLGGDIVRVRKERWIVDLHEFTHERLRSELPAVYQLVRDTVLPEREQNPRASYRKYWWKFAESRPALRAALADLDVAIFTPNTARRRVFTMLPASTCGEMVYVIPSSDYALLGALSSRAHLVWAYAVGSRLGVGNDSRYTTKAVFDPFPFPAQQVPATSAVRGLAEQIDAHRKRQQGLHPRLALTDVYNVLEKLRSGEELTKKDKTVYEQGLVGVLRQLHDELDAAVFDAYGWPHDLDDEQILERLVALNHERAEEEKRGVIRWLRPEFQNPEGASDPVQTEVELDDVSGDGPVTVAAVETVAWPAELAARTQAVMGVLRAADAPVGVEEIARRFVRAPRAQVASILETLARMGFVRDANDTEASGEDVRVDSAAFVLVMR